MQIFLRILCILGVILLVLLLIVLLLLAALLFAPFRYRINADKGEEIHADIRVHWLLHTLRVRVLYGPDGLSWVVRLFGIPIKRGGGKKEEDPSDDDKKEEKPAAEEDGEKKPEPKAEESKLSETEKTEEIKPEKPSEEKTIGKPEEKTDSEKPSEDSAEEADEEDKPKVSFVQKIKDKIRSLWETVRCLYELFIRKKNLLKDYVTKASTKKALLDVWEAVKWILLHIAPKKLSGAVEFGNEDPALTGQAAAVAGVLYPMYGEKFSFVPDFENPGVRGSVEAVGRIRLIGFLTRGIRLFFDKNLRKVIDEAMEVKEKMLETVPEMKKILGKE